MTTEMKWPVREAYEFQLGRSLDQLYEEIGHDHWVHGLVSSTPGEGANDPGAMLDLDTGAGAQDINETSLGKRVFERILPDIRRQLCDEWQLCEKMRSQALYKDELQLAAAISDVIIASVSGLGLPVIVISVLVVKIGVRRLCDCQ